jgi:predicted phage baseplate assembly protein
MPLPTPRLDDRDFQSLVDEAKNLIPRYCPEWTDHNVSDPGVALIELFAWMTDMLLYRVNQVPDKTFVKFLELLGAQLEPPHPARAPVTFYLINPATTETTIKGGAALATQRTDEAPPMTFTLESDLHVQPSRIIGALTRSGAKQNRRWIVHQIDRLFGRGDPVDMFVEPPADRDAFYLGFEHDRTGHVLEFVAHSQLATGSGIDPEHPPLVWEALQGEAGAATGWVRCDVELDTTKGFNVPRGELRVRIPVNASMIAYDLQGISAFWLRCRLTAAQTSGTGYQRSPRLERLEVEVVGATGMARQSTTVHDEVLGTSNGSPGQTFKLRHGPILKDPDQDNGRHRLIVVPPAHKKREERETWQEVDDFSESDHDKFHFMLDYMDGTLHLGPALLQPDHSLRHFGHVPRRHATLTLERYAWGGGLVGNVGPHQIALKDRIPGVRRATNHLPATGGADAQTLDDAKLRLPAFLKNPRRAVTADEVEYFAVKVPGVARARCLPVGAQAGRRHAAQADTPPGTVVVAILARPDGKDDLPLHLTANHFELDSDLQRRVEEALQARSPLGIRVQARPARCTWVWVRATLHVRPGSSEVETAGRAQAALDEFLNPLIGGTDRSGWSFGRLLRRADIYTLLQHVPGIEFVEGVELHSTGPETDSQSTPAPADGIAPGIDGVICGSPRPHELAIAPLLDGR